VLEGPGVDERSVAAGRLGRDVPAAEQDQRVELLDRRQAPVVVTAVFRGVQDGREVLRLRPCHLVVRRFEHPVQIAVGHLHPGQAGVLVVDGQAVLADDVAGDCADKLGVLAEEGLTLGRGGEDARVVEAEALAGVDDHIGAGDFGRGGRGRIFVGTTGGAQHQRGQQEFFR